MKLAILIMMSLSVRLAEIPSVEPSTFPEKNADESSNAENVSPRNLQGYESAEDKRKLTLIAQNMAKALNIPSNNSQPYSVGTQQGLNNNGLLDLQQLQQEINAQKLNSNVQSMESANALSLQAQMLQQLTGSSNGGNQDMDQLRMLQNMQANQMQANDSKRKLQLGALGGALGGTAALGLAGGAMYTRHQQTQEIKKLKREVASKVTENMMRRKRYERQLTNLTEKINNLEDTLADLGESLSSMLSDLDVWTQGHVNMLAS